MPNLSPGSDQGIPKQTHFANSLVKMRAGDGIQHLSLRPIAPTVESPAQSRVIVPLI